ncbi:hypothetical protein CERSUDRAFT_111312 [Gelatoporia subvermispora B]|uniref:Transmembrane protein n=1 Tax=Ceriporiopsis subvermispora (strain B) TaxID=914234 RepID=M2PVD9_CERS8|nr:hypothetical protein CERSUDRAFT_111312 [Gelatoporia subvermispora B]
MSLEVPGQHVVQEVLTVNTSATQFLAHPDFRVISAFFLGWVFLLSVQCIVTSSFVRNLVGWSYRSLFKRRGTPSDLEASGQDLFHRHRVDRHEVDDAALLLVFNMCFASSALTQFASLLEFSPRGANMTCTFVIAWGGMSSQLARLIGILLLNRKLHQIGGRIWEKYSVWAGMFAILALDFAFNATNTGVINEVSQMDIWLCDRQRYLPTALASTVLCTIVEVYLTYRLAILAYSAHGMGSEDRGIVYWSLAQALSLILMEALTTAANVASVSEVATFVPFSVAAIVCLTAFNRSQDLCKAPSTPIPPPESPVVVNIGRSSPGAVKSDIIVESAPHNTARMSTAEHQSTVFLEQSGPNSHLPPDTVVSSVPGVLDSRYHPVNERHGIVIPAGHQALPSPGRPILPNQAEIAERLERELPPLGPIARQPRTRPQVYVVTQEYDQLAPHRSPTSLVLGSDIIRHTSVLRSKEPWSPNSMVERSYFSPESTDSHTSWRSNQQHSLQSSERDMSQESFVDFYAKSPERGSQVTSMWNRSSSAKSPRMSFRHSFLSTPAQAQRELTVVLQRPMVSQRGTVQSIKSQKSKRFTLGRQISRSVRIDTMPVTPATENIRSFIPDPATPALASPPSQSTIKAATATYAVHPQIASVLHNGNASSSSVTTYRGPGLRGPRPLPAPGSPTPSTAR